jgi:hypothetical protein
MKKLDLHVDARHPATSAQHIPAMNVRIEE